MQILLLFCPSCITHGLCSALIFLNTTIAGPAPAVPITMQPVIGSYASVPDFIYGITREIWEDRGIGGKLDKYYAPDILLRAATGFTGSNRGVTAQTLQTLHQFPNRQLVGEDVIWTGHEDGSFLSSHRLTSVMTHTGDGILGKAQGKVVRSRIIADCWVCNQVVVEEWLVRDQASFARCLGLEPWALARDMADRDIRNGVPISYFVPSHDKPSRFVSTVQDDETVASVLHGLTRLWHHKETQVIRDLARGAEFTIGKLRVAMKIAAPFGDARFERSRCGIQFGRRDFGTRSTGGKTGQSGQEQDFVHQFLRKKRGV